MNDDPIYFANAGPVKGPIKAGAVPGSIGVHEAGNPTPIGEASAFTRDDMGREVFRLVVNRVKVPGRFVVVDRAFVKVDG